jgi:hypothetical protein
MAFYARSFCRVIVSFLGHYEAYIFMVILALAGRVMKFIRQRDGQYIWDQHGIGGQLSSKPYLQDHPDI